MNKLFFCLLLILSISFIECLILNDLFSKFFEDKENNKIDFVETSEAHCFTDYLNNNNIEDAKLKGLVSLPSEENIKSYSGYFKVRKGCDNYLYSWFFENKNPNAPVLLWLQGGPGGSSLFGLFNEIGPFFIDKDLNINNREYAWTKNYSVLFIDNPVGTGFSYTGKDDCYARNQEQVSQDLYDLLKQFFTIFNHLKNNPFYLTGESYAGKYIPYLADKIHMNRLESQNFFNLVGVAIGDGLIDPKSQLNYAPLLKQLGMIDSSQYAEMQKKQTEIVNNIKKRKWLKAYDGLSELITGDLGVTSLYTNFTGLKNYFNFLNAEEPLELTYYKKFLEQDSIKQKIHVGNHTYNDGSKVETFMKEDIPQSVSYKFNSVVKNYKVLIYNGQLDIIIAPAITENFLENVHWVYRINLKYAPRKFWKVDSKDKELAGYTKTFKNFTYAVVRNAGHILPYDQPRSAFNLITQFINGDFN